MRAEQFIKDHGLERAREVVANQPKMNATQYRAKDKKYSSLFKPSPEIVYVADLKRLVESVDLVNRLGGIEETRKTLAFILRKRTNSKYAMNFEKPALEQAIADYEVIYEQAH